MAAVTNDAAACVTLETVGAVHVAGGLAGTAAVVGGGGGAATRVTAAGVLTTGSIMAHVINNIHVHVHTTTCTHALTIR